MKPDNAGRYYGTQGYTQPWFRARFGPNGPMFHMGTVWHGLNPIQQVPWVGKSTISDCTEATP